MLKHKRLRQKGKIQMSKYFQKFNAGDSVAVSKDLTVPFGYGNKIHGRTGKVVAKRGSAYYIEVNDLNKPKRYLLKPIHLRKIEDIK